MVDQPITKAKAEVARTVALGMLADMIRQAIPDGRVTSLAATVVGDDGMIMQYLAGVGSPDVIRLIIPADRLADLNAFRDLIIDATPEAPGGR